MQKNFGFTLIEIMIMVAIIALLAAIAVPSFMRARQRAQNTKVIETIRVAAEAFQTYAAENDVLPAGASAGTIPGGMDSYLRRVRWTEETPVGGEWQWSGDSIRINRPTAPLAQLQAIDEAIDDGNENEGMFRLNGNHWRYTIQ